MDTTNYSSFAKKLAAAFSDPVRGEAMRKEIYHALVSRLESHKGLRKKLTQAGVEPGQHTVIDDWIRDYEGPDGLLVLFMGEEDAADRVKATGKDDRQLDIEAAIISNAPSADAIDRAFSALTEADKLTTFLEADVRRALGRLNAEDVAVVAGYATALVFEHGPDQVTSPEEPAAYRRLLDMVVESRAVQPESNGKPPEHVTIDPDILDAEDAAGGLLAVSPENLAEVRAADDRDLADLDRDDREWLNTPLRTQPEEPVSNLGAFGKEADLP